jgi:hypothetical protein
LNSTYNFGPVYYSPESRHLITIPQYFKGKGATAVRLAQGILVGATITPGTLIAYISWMQGPPERLVAPHNCWGTITQINFNFDHLGLSDRAQILLQL